MKQMQEWVSVADPFLKTIHDFLNAEGLDDSSKA